MCYSNYQPKSYSNGLIKEYFSNRPSWPSHWSTFAQSSYNYLPQLHVNANSSGYPASISNDSKQAINDEVGQFCYQSSRSTHYRDYRSYQAQRVSSNLVAGSSVGCDYSGGAGYNDYEMNIALQEGAMKHKSNNETSRKIRGDLSSDFTERSSAISRNKGGKKHTDNFKSSKVEKKSSKDQKVNFETYNNDCGLAASFVPDMNLCVKASGPLTKNSLDEPLPLLNVSEHKAPQITAKSKASSVAKGDDQPAKLALGETKCVEVRQASAKANNLLDHKLQDHASNSTKNRDQSISTEPETRSQPVKNTSFKSTTSTGLAAKIEATSNSDSIMEAGPSNSESKESNQDQKDQDSPVFVNAPAKEEGVNIEKAVLKNIPREKELNRSGVICSSVNENKIKNGVGHTDSIHPFARGKQLKKRSKEKGRNQNLAYQKTNKNVEGLTKPKLSEAAVGSPPGPVGHIKERVNDVLKIELSMKQAKSESVATNHYHQRDASKIGGSINQADNSASTAEVKPKEMILQDISTKSIIGRAPPSNDVIGQDQSGRCARNAEKANSDKGEKVGVVDNPLPALQDSEASSQLSVASENHSSPQQFTGKTPDSLNIAQPCSSEQTTVIGSKSSTLKRKKKKGLSKTKADMKSMSNMEPSIVHGGISETPSSQLQNAKVQCENTRAILDFENGEQKSGSAGLGLVIVNTSVSRSSGTSPAQSMPTIACKKKAADITDADGDSNKATPVGKAIPSKSSQHSSDANIKASSSDSKSINQKNRTDNQQKSQSNSSDLDHEEQAELAKSKSECKSGSVEEPRPTLQVERLSYAAAAAAMAVAGQIAKDAKISALSDHSQAVEETLKRLEKLQEQEMEKAVSKKRNAAYNSTTRPASTSTSASPLTSALAFSSGLSSVSRRGVAVNRRGPL